MQCQRLGVGDINVSRNDFVVRAAKRAKDRNATFPDSLNAELQNQQWEVTTIHDKDLRQGYGERVISAVALGRQ